MQTMQAWMTLWTALLAVSGVAFVLMLVIVAGGAIGELRETLRELRADTEDAAAHPETLDEAV
jgi:hypothetical protein